jgi:hypothetical protein
MMEAFLLILAFIGYVWLLISPDAIFAGLTWLLRKALHCNSYALERVIHQKLRFLVVHLRKG